MKTNIFILYLLIVASAYATPRSNEKIGILSYFNDKAYFKHVGATVFENEEERIDLNSWNINSLLQENIKQTFNVKLYNSISIIDEEDIDISERTLNLIVGPFATYIDRRGKLIIEKAKKFGVDKLILLNTVSYGYHSHVHNPHVMAFVEIQAYFFDIKNMEYIGKEYIYTDSHFVHKRELLDTEKEKIYSLVTQEENEQIANAYKKIIFDKKLVDKELLMFFKKNNSPSFDDYDDHIWMLESMLNPLHHTPNTFHLLPKNEVERLREHFNTLLPVISNKLFEALPF